MHKLNFVKFSHPTYVNYFTNLYNFFFLFFCCKSVGLNMFLFLNFQLILKLVYFKTLHQNISFIFEIREFSHSNQMLLGLFYELFILFDTFLL